MAKSTSKKTAKGTKARQPARKTTSAAKSRTSKKATPKGSTKRSAIEVKRTSKARTPARPGGSNGVPPRGVSKERNVHPDRDANKGGSRPQAAPTPEPAAAKIVSVLKAKDLEFFRELLLAKRRELLGDMHSMEQEALRAGGHSNLSNLPMHMADMGTDNYEQEFTLGLVEKDRQLLREINTALQKIREGTYGICEGTGKPISRARLEAQPWARYSIEYAREMEKGKRPPTMPRP